MHHSTNKNSKFFVVLTKFLLFQQNIFFCAVEKTLLISLSTLIGIKEIRTAGDFAPHSPKFFRHIFLKQSDKVALSICSMRDNIKTGTFSRRYFSTTGLIETIIIHSEHIHCFLFNYIFFSFFCIAKSVFKVFLSCFLEFDKFLIS